MFCNSRVVLIVLKSILFFNENLFYKIRHSSLIFNLLQFVIPSQS